MYFSNLNCKYDQILQITDFKKEYICELPINHPKYLIVKRVHRSQIVYAHRTALSQAKVQYSKSRRSLHSFRGSSLLMQSTWLQHSLLFPTSTGQIAQNTLCQGLKLLPCSYVTIRKFNICLLPGGSLIGNWSVHIGVGTF